MLRPNQLHLIWKMLSTAHDLNIKWNELSIAHLRHLVSHDITGVEAEAMTLHAKIDAIQVFDDVYDDEGISWSGREVRSLISDLINLQRDGWEVYTWSGPNDESLIIAVQMRS